MTPQQIDILKEELAKEKSARLEAERILQDKSRNLLLISRDLKLANHKLKELLEKKSTELQGVFENINDAYLLVDMDLNIIKMNEKAETLFSHNLSDKPLNFTDIVYKKDAEYALDSFNKLLQSGSFNNFTFRIFTNKGEVKWVQINASLFRDNQKKKMYAQGIVRDITDIKNLTIEKEAFVQELKRKNEELEEYAHIVSHDLKSPLRSLYALFSWVKSDNIDKLDATTLENFTHIEDTIQNMEILISDILTYSSANVKMDNEHLIDLNKVVDEVVKSISIPSHISVNRKCELPTIKGEKIKFQQLFQNLIGNAIRFIEKEKGYVNIDCEQENGFYKFIVEDNGIGIEPKYHEKIFKVFQSLNKDSSSTGVGLSIVKKIINLYGGTIYVDSELGKGAKFIFTLKK